MKRYSFLVEVEVPDRASFNDTRSYIYNAITDLRGALQPPGAEGSEDEGDPMWDLKVKSVR